jgi:hypothetical protein
MNAGIDKLILTTNEYIVKNPTSDHIGRNENKAQGKAKEDIPVIVVNTGNGHEYIRANSLYYNVPDFYNVSINQIGIQVIVNPSKVLHPYELADMDQVKKVVQAVEKDMKQAGIMFDPLTSSVSRLDLAKQKVTDRTPNAYTPAFTFMKGKKMKGVQYDTGYRWGNNQHENTIYDKSVESKLSFPNLLRNEVKIKKTQATRRMTGIHNLSNLYEAGDENLTRFYNEYLNTKLFSGTIQDQTVLDFDGEVERLSSLRKQGRNALLKYLAATGVNEIVRKAGTPEIIFKIMHEAGYSRKEISKQRYVIKDLLSVAEIKDIDVRVLIDELRTMFAA